MKTIVIGMALTQLEAAQAVTGSILVGLVIPCLVLISRKGNAALSQQAPPLLDSAKTSSATNPVSTPYQIAGTDGLHGETAVSAYSTTPSSTSQYPHEFTTTTPKASMYEQPPPAAAVATAVPTIASRAPSLLSLLQHLLSLFSFPWPTVNTNASSSVVGLFPNRRRSSSSRDPTGGSPSDMMNHARAKPFVQPEEVVDEAGDQQGDGLDGLSTLGDETSDVARPDSPLDSYTSEIPAYLRGNQLRSHRNIVESLPLNPANTTCTSSASLA
ncbi:hypothetical protein BSLG_004326 [Batrachochytrium salamandrivorans]|nr:hypothetical protein BSLG_004326 [Batrachochytrium salamandrivorans]